MENIIHKYSDIVIDYHIPPAREVYNKLTQEARITFIDTSKLVAHDILFFLDADSIRRKYSYQWMNSDNTLIIRWDNAPNHRGVGTFPNHKHIETDENVKSSEEMSLNMVLSYIESIIKNRTK